MGKKTKQQKRSPKTIDSHASKVTVNSVTFVFGVHFKPSDTFKVCKLA